MLESKYRNNGKHCKLVKPNDPAKANNQSFRSRRNFLRGTTVGGFSYALGLSPSYSDVASVAGKTPELSGNQFDLDVQYLEVGFGSRKAIARTINGSLPAPILRWKEGEEITLRVRNQLAEDTSIHWHGIILPTGMDGVPGFSFSGIRPGETFEYKFRLQQSGTYWYHSHSGFQEQQGMYGAIIIDPAEPDPCSYDREHVLLLSDWTDESPMKVYATLKKKSHFYNTRERTVVDWWREVQSRGWSSTSQDREMWNEMRMSDRDISDVTAYTYTYLLNGRANDQAWEGIFRKGETIRLRVINAAAMTLFDVRVPGLKMTVISADGQNVQPFSVDDFRIGVAETYDVLITPEEDMPYAVFAQAIDRSGFVCGHLTPSYGVKAEIPEMDPAPILTHADMGMSHHAHMGHGQHGGMDHLMHHGMDHSQSKDNQIGSGKAGYGSAAPLQHSAMEQGVQVDMLAETPEYKLDDPGIGLREHQSKYGRRVLTYADLFNLYPTPDPREPEREIQLHLTGNMSRYMWSFDGIKFADADPLHLKYGERVRITLVNDTMMSHPIHLHGMWSDLETGDPKHIPRKHTVIVQPGAKVSYLVTADAKGRWAYHCHLMFHMLGMFREVRVS